MRDMKGFSYAPDFARLQIYISGNYVIFMLYCLWMFRVLLSLIEKNVLLFIIVLNYYIVLVCIFESVYLSI